MKNLLFVLWACSIVLSSCSKSGSTETATPVGNQNSNTTNVSAVPSTFTQKVLLEILTGAGQPQCTDGTSKMNDLVNANPTTAITACIHYSDAMEIPLYTVLESTFSNGMPPSFPTAMVNRIPSTGITILNRTQWLSNVNVNKQKTAKCGVAMKTNVNAGVATIEAHAGFNQNLTGNYNITLYLVENDVTGNGNQYDQRNSYNVTSGHAYYQAGDPIVGFQHNYTVRKVISANLGDALSATNMHSSGEEVKNYSISISGFKEDDLYVIAFINKVGTSATTHEIMNVQRVKLGATKDWD